MLVGELFKLAEGLLLGGLVKDEVLEELEVLLRQALVGQVRILSEDICGQVVVLVLAVQQDQVGERFRWERRVLQQEVELLEACRRVLLDVHERRVVQSDWIELVFVPRGHVHEGLAGSCRVLHRVLDGGLQVECFNQCRLFQRLRVTHALDFDTFGV